MDRSHVPGGGNVSCGAQVQGKERWATPTFLREMSWHRRSSEQFSGLMGCVCFSPNLRGQEDGGPGSGSVMPKIGLALRVYIAEGGGGTGGWTGSRGQTPGHNHKGAGIRAYQPHLSRHTPLPLTSPLQPTAQPADRVEMGSPGLHSFLQLIDL